ncbi:bifunctional protein GlmU [Octadecabacter antarcticus 307]|uniref:Bifunctional protein GlmU n=1 Tax=Octadecabacter antarcticus 307 TaxID=391626 RepID=M9R7G8_9RHOB|nr:bifunctional UDP-N-acetylglucosamine diphosphorylase/glucosamine-1-phosphate N-acetyltransferase GlmU [Octadecabacter antarcticus]AGI67713.1 bifunctional protein GlmU [Octadecabacter antarcticus 307]
MTVALIILAAGKGTRMMSDIPKVLHEVAGGSLLVHAMMSGSNLEPERTVVVAGYGADAVGAVAQAFDEDAIVVIQQEQLGTGHAVLQARAALVDFDGDVIILYGDTPFIQPETLDAMLAARKASDVVVLGFKAADPGRYGRLVMTGDTLERIVEFKDSSNEERAISLCNSGVIAARSDVLFDLLDAVSNDNAAGEYYLTDIIGIARAKDLSATVVRCDEAETMGVNSRTELADAEAAFQGRARKDAMANGVSLRAPDTVYFSFDTYIGPDSMVEPNVVFAAGVTVENNATIRAFSHLEGCHVSRGSVVGPYARLRPGTELAENVKVGNFVEIKNAVIEAGAKVNHLSYIGDAHVGERSNIGAGTITCNYDGVSKHRTTIGADVFVGSNTMLVAPVTLGNESMTATGTIVTKNVPVGDMAVGRARQENKTGFARRMQQKFKSSAENAAKDS